MKYLFGLLFSLLPFCGNAQPPADTLPYLKYPQLPAFNLLMPDSASVFNTFHIPEGRPTVLVFFSPDCEHCQQTAKEIVARRDSLTDVQFYFFTPASLPLLNQFVQETELMKLKHVKAGKDYDIFFPVFYGTKYVPYIAVYDQKKKFVTMWEGKMKMDEFMNKMLKMQAKLKIPKR